MMKPFSIYLYGRDFGPLEEDFEGVCQRLALLERMFLEPDGSFVWRADSVRGPWQIDGMIYDAAGVVQYVDLKGQCPRGAWERLVTAIGNGSLQGPHASVLVLPGQSRGSMEAFCRDIWGQEE